MDRQTRDTALVIACSVGGVIIVALAEYTGLRALRLLGAVMTIAGVVALGLRRRG
jgi:hypothetical protein